MAEKKLTEIKAIPFQGGMNKSVQPALLPLGSYSNIVNMRQCHPGMKARPGQIKQHSTADGTNRVMSLYQFSKGKSTERHFYAQMSDGDVLEATTAPPGVTTGAFGSEVFDGTASGMIPASWSVLNDALFFSNGVNQHQVYYGNTTYVDGFIVYKGAGAIPDFPILGEDYSSEVSDGQTSTVAVLDSLGDLDVDYDCVFIRVPLPIKQLTYTVASGKANANCAVAQMKYRKTDNTWAALTIVDNTSSPAYGATFSDAFAATTNWTAVTATLSSVAGGQSGNCLQVAESGGAAAGDAYHDITTVVGQKYWLKYYFKKGTADNGKVGIGTSGDEFGIYDSGNLSDANWTLHETEFTATATSTRITLRTNDATAGETSLFDTLSVVTGATLAQTGSMTWTAPTDSMPSYMFGQYGYWYQLSLSAGDLDSEVELTSVTFEHSWASLVDMWDGSLIDCLEAQFNDVSGGATVFYVYGGLSVTLNSMVGTAGSEDFLYIAFAYPIDALYVDVGSTPSTTGSNSIDAISYWNGSAWASIGTYTDSTAGLNESGYIAFARRTDEQPLNLNKTSYYAYWYKLTVAQTLSASVNVGFSAIPRLYIDDFGKGVSNCAWKGRMAYTFDLFPEYVYISANNAPFVLSGMDSGFMEIGDGRSNRTYMKPFYSELLCVQEEKGTSGGTITLLQGTRPENYGKLILSTIYGVMNSQCVEVIDAFEMEKEGSSTVAIGLSSRGIWLTNGRSVRMIPGFDAIKCYFDTTDTTNCIRTGYESHMWLKYDSTFDCLRIGLVTGSSAAVCNTWLIYDIKTKTFSQDSYAQELSCMTEAEAGSGNVPVLQLGGGVDDGFVYLLNYGQNDVSTAVDAYATMEIDGQGRGIHIGEAILRMKVQAAGDCTITPYKNSVAQTAITKSMTAENTNETIRRHRIPINIKNQHMSLKFEHNTASQDFYLLDLALDIEEYELQ